MSWGKEYQSMREPQRPEEVAPRGAKVCTGCPLPSPNRTSTAKVTPTRGSSSSQTLSRSEAILRVCLIASVSSTAAREPIKPPSRPPTAHGPTLVNRSCSLLFSIVPRKLNFYRSYSKSIGVVKQNTLKVFTI